MKKLYRRFRVIIKKLLGIEPVIQVLNVTKLVFYGSEYGGWMVPIHFLTKQSVVVDFGIGEDATFPLALIKEFNQKVFAFDPTPKSIEYSKNLVSDNFIFYPLGLASKKGNVNFYLPSNEKHVSGTTKRLDHTGGTEVKVEMISLDEVFELISDDIKLLKLDIEGSEYEVLLSDSFKRNSGRIDIICIEFHHRWNEYGAKATLNAVSVLQNLGYTCIWANPYTNEEFTFIKKALLN